MRLYRCVFVECLHVCLCVAWMCAPITFVFVFICVRACGSSDYVFAYICVCDALLYKQRGFPAIFRHPVPNSVSQSSKTNPTSQQKSSQSALSVNQS